MSTGPRSRDARDRVLDALPRWLTRKVPRDHWESEAAFQRRRRVVGVTSLVGAGLLGAGLSTKPGSGAFFGLTLATAGTWIVGGVTSGRLHLGWQQHRGPGGHREVDARRGERKRGDEGGTEPVAERLVRPIVTPVLLGAAAFGAFYAAAMVARRIPPLERWIGSVLSYADAGDDRWVLVTALANGAAEEVFFRGALYAAVGERAPVLTSTGVYVLATTATRNPALVLASGAMGLLFAAQRRASGGILAPVLTHVTWSILMLRFLPPLFRRATAQEAVVKGAVRR